MILLATKGLPQVRDAGCGRLFTPRHVNSVERTAEAGIPWAADNDCFNGLDVGAWLGMLSKLVGVPGCLFVVCPDVVGDHDATLELWRWWSGTILACNLPIAFVLQDGVDASTVPWDECDAVFVGGSTDFKLSTHTASIVAEAKERGKWAHMGRVNSLRRIEYAASLGCDSFDGSSVSRFWDAYSHRFISAGTHKQGVLIGKEQA